ncbi:50S ribosomal protein L23 [Candidatus Peregrinibacteria bacterium]|nr:50S ribosomal protein L23 [Candidatus Peregrinibacteria bacterium]
MKDYSTIIQSIITEKSSDQQASGQYTFLVKKDSTKIDIKNAVKTLYGVEVATVKTMVVPKKTRIIGRGHEFTKRPVHKKAIVTLKDNKTIDPNALKDGKSAKAKTKSKSKK